MGKACGYLPLLRKRDESLESQVYTDTALAEIAYLSAQNPSQVFSLMHHINEESLRRCFDKLDGKKALGIDGIQSRIWENDWKRICPTMARMKRMACRPQAVRRVLSQRKESRATRPWDQNF